MRVFTRKSVSFRLRKVLLIRLEDGREVINFCANNYLGLSSHPDILSAAKQTIDTHGFG